MRLGMLGVVTALSLILTNCATLQRYEIYRTGYTFDETKPVKACEVEIEFKEELDSDEWDVVGQIHLHKGMFTEICDEEFARQILRKEACSVAATKIQIFSETKQESKGDCYQARAYFLTPKIKK